LRRAGTTRQADTPTAGSVWIGVSSLTVKPDVEYHVVAVAEMGGGGDVTAPVAWGIAIAGAVAAATGAGGDADPGDVTCVCVGCGSAEIRSVEAEVRGGGMMGAET
jgi:hypothetical protein